MKKLIPLTAIVVVMSLIFVMFLSRDVDDPSDDTKLGTLIQIGGVRNRPIRFVAPTPVTKSTLVSGDSVKLQLTPETGAPGLEINFWILNEYAQVTNADVFVNGQKHGNSSSGSILLPPAGQNLVLQFEAVSYKTISYTLNYKVKSRQSKQLVVQLEPAP